MLDTSFGTNTPRMDDPALLSLGSSNRDLIFWPQIMRNFASHRPLSLTCGNYGRLSSNNSFLVILTYSHTLFARHRNLSRNWNLRPELFMKFGIEATQNPTAEGFDLSTCFSMSSIVSNLTTCALNTRYNRLSQITTCLGCTTLPIP